MTLKLVITQTAPPGGWYYKDPDTGREFRPVAYNDLRPEVNRHRKANGLGPVTKEAIDQQVCLHVPPEWCGNAQAEGRVSPVTFAEIIQGTMLLAEVVGRAVLSKLFGLQSPFVQQQDADSRARTCAHCHYNAGIQGCTSCNLGKLHAIVETIIGKRTAQGSQLLNACKICKCALKAKVWIEHPILQRHLSDDQNAALPEWCWCKKVSSPNTVPLHS